MPKKKSWVFAAACLLLLTACSPSEWIANAAKERILRVERYPDQQRPSVGYASAASGYNWKKGGETQPRTAWADVQETQSTGDPDEVSLEGNTGFSVRQKTIVGKSLESVVEQGAAYEYKHKVESVRIDAEFTDGERTIASFPYVYKGLKYMGIVTAENKGNSYIYKQLSFSPELTDEGKEIPFVPGNGSMDFGEDSEGRRAGIAWTGGTVNDERIREIVIHFEDGGASKVPIEDDQATYLIPAETDRDVQYIESLDADGKALYAWQF